MAPAEVEDRPAAPPKLPRWLDTPAAAEPFAVVVVGLGLVGSAAARHLSQALGSSTLGIGPAEPEEAALHSGPFASHYDQGRLTRISDPDPIWAALAARSMLRYSSLERTSGIKFHHPVGSLRVSPLGEHSLHQCFEVGKQQGAVQEMIESQQALQAQFPCFQFQAGDAAIMERGSAGYINPRCLVSAQLTLAQRSGACIVRDAVKEIVPTRSGVRVVTQQGNTFWARKALVCAGSYSSCLLPGARTLDLTTHARSVVMAEVDAKEAERLGAMPTFIWRLPHHPHLNWVYGCPPVKYPDGRVALKVGGTTWQAAEVGHSEAELNAWFRGNGDPVERAALEEVLLRELMPGLRPLNLSCKPCAVSFTAHGRPYIDSADGKRPPMVARVFVAAGGCGAAAKSSDEIGRIAALLVLHGRWCSEMDPSLFRAIFKAKPSTSS